MIDQFVKVNSLKMRAFCQMRAVEMLLTLVVKGVEFFPTCTFSSLKSVC